jgi:hypothetical protein
MAISNEETPAPAQGREEGPIGKALEIIDTKIDNLMNACEARTIQGSKVNERRYGGDQHARAYAIQADHTPPYTPMNTTPLTTPMGLTYH